VHGREERDPRIALPFVVGFVVAIVLGFWGWSRVSEAHPGPAAQLAQHFLGRSYLTLQLFVLHPQELPRSDPWQLEMARFLAPVVLAIATVYVLTTTFRSRIRHLLLKIRRDHVIVCGAGVHGTRLAGILVGARTPVVLVDIDPRAPGMQGRRRPRESRLVADTVNGDTLHHAGVRHAARLIAVTGDDIVNAQIASTVRELSSKEGWRRNPLVLVQTEDPALARFLEDHAIRDRAAADTPASAQEPSRGGPGEALEVRAFGANALAAVALFGGGPMAGTVSGQDGDARLAELETDGDGHLLLAGDHGLLEAIVVTALRRGRARRLRAPAADASVSPLRITLVGRNAQSLCEGIGRRWWLDPAVVDLRATDIDPRTEPSLLASRSWSEWQSDISHAVVACEDEHASITIAVTLSRVFGPAVKVTRVATQPENELDKQLEAYAQRRAELADIKVLSIADLAWGIHAQRVEDVPPFGRLVAALRAEGIEEDEAKRMARDLLERDDLGLHSDAAPRITPASAGVASGLLRAASRGRGSIVTVGALVAAGLNLDLRSRSNLGRAAEQLSREQSEDAFTAWCEYMRLVPDAPSEASELLERAASAGAAAVALRLKAAALGASEALDSLAPDEAVVEDIRSRASRRIVIFAGGAASMSAEAREAVRELLACALHRYDGLIVTGGNDVGVCGAVRDAARVNNVPVLGYAPAGSGLEGTWQRSTPAGDFGKTEPVAMWTDILAAAQARQQLRGAPNAVRLVAFPGGAITQAEVLFARALGAAVASLDPCQELVEPLEEMLPFGSGGVLSLPNDPMTLRAFLTWPNESLEEERRVIAARALHDQYRMEHRKHKQDDDPALAPWERLSTSLQRSNLAAVDDIPNKLHVLGKRLCAGGERLVLHADEVERLAEMEHGRYNCERLSTGWELGRSRQVSRHVSPYLTPWRDLDEQVRQWDRDAVRAIDRALQKAGWGVAPETPSGTKRPNEVSARTPGRAFNPRAGAAGRRSA